MNGADAVQDEITPIAELIDLTRRLCSESDSTALVEQLGAAQASERSSNYTRIEPTRYRSMHAIEVRPRKGDEFGLADIEPARPDDWSLAELDATFGPFSRIPPMPGRIYVLQGFWQDPSLPADAAIYLELTGPVVDPASRIQAISLRIEPTADDDS